VGSNGFLAATQTYSAACLAAEFPCLTRRMRPRVSRAPTTSDPCCCRVGPRASARQGDGVPVRTQELTHTGRQERHSVANPERQGGEQGRVRMDGPNRVRQRDLVPLPGRPPGEHQPQHCPDLHADDRPSLSRSFLSRPSGVSPRDRSTVTSPYTHFPCSSGPCGSGRRFPARAPSRQGYEHVRLRPADPGLNARYQPTPVHFLLSVDDARPERGHDLRLGLTKHGEPVLFKNLTACMRPHQRATRRFTTDMARLLSPRESD
jgi:hypothetical protein